MSFAEQAAHEIFDLELLAMVELDLLPILQLPDSDYAATRNLALTLCAAAQVYDLDLPGLRTLPASIAPLEPRFSLDFAEQARADVFGTTAGVVEAPKERVAYWAFDLLFQLCASDSTSAQSYCFWAVIRRLRAARAGGATSASIAELALPALMARCEACLRTYLVDKPLIGRMPFARVRDEELVYVLDQLLRLHIDGRAYATAFASQLPLDRFSASPSPRTHLIRLHPLFVALLALPRPSVPIPPALFARDAEDEAAARSIRLGRIGRKMPAVENDMQGLARRCLDEVGRVLY